MSVGRSYSIGYISHAGSTREGQGGAVAAAGFSRLDEDKAAEIPTARCAGCAGYIKRLFSLLSCPAKLYAACQSLSPSATSSRMDEQVVADSKGSPPLAKGTYAQAKPTDLRSPCPMVNCLANHGYIARDGRDIHSNELYAAVREVGVGPGLGAALAYTIFFEHHPDPEHAPPRNWWQRFLPNPFAAFGMRRPGQTDSMGRPVLDLDQFALPGVIEHDISLTRRDHQQPQGNNALQLDLVEELLRSSTDGKTISRENLAVLRKHRIAVQRDLNPGLLYGAFQHLLSCGEISLILDVVGDGTKIPIDYARAFLMEERLPVLEGWKGRRWWKLGFIELQISIFKVWRLIGVKF